MQYFMYGSSFGDAIDETEKIKSDLMKLSNYEKRRMLERDRVTTKEIEKDIKDGIRDKFIQANKQREDNKERRELNRVKAGQYQIIKDSTKIRKYDKKARSKVIKMSPEMIESLMARKNGRIEL